MKCKAKKKKKSSKYPTKRKEISRDFRGIRVLTGYHGNLRIHPLYDVRYEQRIGPHEYQCRNDREEEIGPELNEMMQYLQISDRQLNLTVLMEGGLELIQKITERFIAQKWRNQKRAHEKERLRRARAKEKKADEKQDKLVHKGLAFGRRLES